MFWEKFLTAGLAVWLFMTLLWLWSVVRRNASIVDPWWGPGFVLLSWVHAGWGGGQSDRRLLILVLVALWGLRLGIHLFIRNLGKGEDFRYQQFRRDFGAKRYWWISYFQVFLLQGLLMWIISLPLALGLMHCDAERVISFEQFITGQQIWCRPLSAWDYLGIALWAIGFYFEAVGDWQLARFRANPLNKMQVMDRGLWRYTRHPNYFGDSMVWWGFGCFSLGADEPLGLIGPAIMTLLLLKVSGVSLLERSLKAEKPGYAEYVRRTNAFFPWFPKA